MLSPPHASPFREAFSSASSRSSLTVWASFCLRTKKKTHVKNTRSHAYEVDDKPPQQPRSRSPWPSHNRRRRANTTYRYSGYYRHGIAHAAGRYAFAHHYAPAAEQTDNWGWGEQNDQPRWSYRRAATEAFAWSTRAARRGRSGTTSDNGDRVAYHGGVGARPRAWCGWEMRQLVGGDPGPEYNLARNWARWGHAGPAGVGAVVVWSHHVGKIVGQQNGQWIIESGNDGNRVRTRPLPISRAIAIRWG
jgi:hypothetical protein